MKFLTPVFAFLFLANASHGKILDRVSASVNGSLIMMSDVLQFRRTQSLRAQLDPLFAGTPVASKPGGASDTEIIDFLINEKVISAQFPTADETVDQEIINIQANNRISRQALITTLEEQGYKFDQYRDLIRASLSKRSLIDRDIRTKVYISDDDVKNYYYNQFAGSRESFLFHIKLITISPRSYKSAGAARSAAQSALEALQSGESFEEVSKRFSEDSAPGDLGFLPESEITPQIRTALKKLKVGEVSPVLGNEQSAYFILKLVDIKSGQEKNLTDRQESIRNHLATQEYQRQIDLWLQRIRQNAHIYLAKE